MLYDAFISYSHAKDKPVTSALQGVMQKLGKPWYRRRTLRIFRDDTSLAATPELWPTIEQAPGQSRYLLVIASPEFARSKWCGLEVAFSLEHRSVDTILVAVASGEIVWDDTAGDFRWDDATPLPAILKSRFRTEPKWIDLRAYREQPDAGHPMFIEAAADFAAAIHGMPKEDLLSQEVRQQKRALRLAWSAAVVLLALAGVAGWQWADAVKQQRIAQAQRDRAERTLEAATVTADSLIFDLAQEFRKRRGMPADLIRLILERVQNLQQQLAAVGERPANLRYLEAVGLDELYATYRAIGDAKAALAAAERSRAIMQDLVKTLPDDPVLASTLIIAYNNVGDARFHVNANWQDSLKIYREALAIAVRAVAQWPDRTGTQSDLSVTLGKVGDMLFQGEQYKEALANYRRALEIVQKLVTAEPDSGRWQADLVFIRGRIGLTLTILGQHEDALAEYRANVELNEKLAAANPNDTGAQRRLFFALQRFGASLSRLGNHEEAIAIIRRAIKLIEALAATDVSNLEWQRDVAIALDEYGDVLRNAKQLQAAFDAYRTSMGRREKLIAIDPANTNWLLQLIHVSQKAASVAYEAKDFAAALDIRVRLLEVRKKRLDPNNPELLRELGLAGC